ncbi:MAG: hypothetical protein ABI333_05465, partial [bacterium]
PGSRPRSSGRSRAADAAATGMRPPPAKKSTLGTAVPPVQHDAARRSACRAMYTKRLAALTPTLARLGVTVDAAELARLYELDQLRTLNPCLALRPAQRECVSGQANALLASQACRLPESLGLHPPRTLTEALSPKPVALTPVASRATLAGLRGMWTWEDVRRGALESMEIGAGGKTRIRRFRGGRLSGSGDEVVLEFRNELEVLRVGRFTTERHVFFRLDRSTLLMSGNRLHRATRLPNRFNFTLLLSPDRVLQVRVGSCDVIDLSHLATVKASCTWSVDEHHSLPALEIRYVLGRWPLTHRFFRIREHLIHEQLLARRFVRRSR